MESSQIVIDKNHIILEEYEPSSLQNDDSKGVSKGVRSSSEKVKKDIFIHICIIDFSIRYAQSQSACRLSDSERNDNEVLFSQPHYLLGIVNKLC